MVLEEDIFGCAVISPHPQRSGEVGRARACGNLIRCELFVVASELSRQANKVNGNKNKRGEEISLDVVLRTLSKPTSYQDRAHRQRTKTSTLKFSKRWSALGLLAAVEQMRSPQSECTHTN